MLMMDPSGAARRGDEMRDEIGVIVAGLGSNDHGFVLADRSGDVAQW